MATPDAETTTVNLKSMPVSVWNRAKNCANRQGETLAEWLTRAITQLADREESAPRETVQGGQDSRRDSQPDRPRAQAPELAPTDLEALVRAMTMAAESSGVPIPKATGQHVLAVGAAHLRAARGLPAPKPRAPRTRRQQVLEGQAEAAIPAIPEA